MTALAVILALVALVASIVAFVWLIVVAARLKKYLWIPAIILLPFAALIFAVLNWAEARRPFMLSVLATVLFLVATPLLNRSGGPSSEIQMTESDPIPRFSPAEEATAPFDAFDAAPAPAPASPPRATPAPARREPARTVPPAIAPPMTAPAPATGTAVAAQAQPPVETRRPVDAEAPAPAAPAPETAAAAVWPVKLAFAGLANDRGEVLRFVNLWATNSTAKTVRKLDFTLHYLGRNGRQLKQWTTSYQDPHDKPLVGPHAAREFQCPAFQMPDTTDRVLVNLHEVRFDDDSRWSAP